MFRVRVLGGGLIRAADYIAAQRRRADLIAKTADAFRNFDLLVSAVATGPAPLLTEQRPDEGFAKPFLTTPANVAGIPALAVCAGRTRAGLPSASKSWGRLGVMRPCYGSGTNSSARQKRAVCDRNCECSRRTSNNRSDKMGINPTTHHVPTGSGVIATDIKQFGSPFGTSAKAGVHYLTIARRASSQGSGRSRTAWAARFPRPRSARPVGLAA